MEKASSSKRPRYDTAFRAEALRLANESRSVRVIPSQGLIALDHLTTKRQP